MVRALGRVNMLLKVLPINIFGRCRDEGEIKSIPPFVCEDAALRRKQRKIVGDHFYEGLDSIEKTPLECLLWLERNPG